MDILNKEAWEQKALINAGALSVSELMQEIPFVHVFEVGNAITQTLNELSEQAHQTKSPQIFQALMSKDRN